MRLFAVAGRTAAALRSPDDGNYCSAIVAMAPQPCHDEPRLKSMDLPRPAMAAVCRMAWSGVALTQTPSVSASLASNLVNPALVAE